MVGRLGLARGLVARLLTDEVDWQQQQSTPDGMGGQTQSYVSRGSVACRFEAQTRPHEQPEGSRLVAVMLWRVYLPVGTGVGPADRLVKNGITFEVTDRDTARTEGAVLRVNAVQLT
jgi:hypothetical protein